MASLIQYYTGGTSDKCIALSNSQFGRKHGYGDNWNSLRFGLSVSFEDTGSSLSGVILRIGLCSGTTNMPGDATTDNSFGIKFSVNWTRFVMPPPIYRWFGGGADRFVFSRVGAVESVTGLAAANIDVTVSGSLRTAFFLDVIKGSPNYTCNFFTGDNYTGARADCTPAAFMNQVSAAVPVLGGHTLRAGAGLPINTALNGILDTVYVGWNLVTPHLLVSDIAVVRLS